MASKGMNDFITTTSLLVNVYLALDCGAVQQEGVRLAISFSLH